MKIAVWQKGINTGAFLLSICCVAAFLVLFFISEKTGLIFHLHPLMLNLWMAVFTFFLGMIGFSGATNGKRLIMSIMTLLITIILSVLLLFIVVVGKLLS